MTKVLVIDDESIIRDTLKSMLELDGFEVRTGFDGLDGLEIVKSEWGESLDVIVLDIKMPRMDGIEVLREIKSFNPELEVIMTTGHGAVESAIDAMRIGAFDYINKPMEYEELAISIDRAASVRNERKNRMIAENALKESEEKYRAVVEGASDGILIASEYRLIYGNPTFFSMSGYDQDEIESLLLSDIFSCEKNDCIHGIKNGSSILMKCVDGKGIYVEIKTNSIKYMGQECTLYILRDVTERIKAEEKIRYLSYYDNLTGVYNRTYFEDKWNQLEKNPVLPSTLIIADLNGLKIANDGFGHTTGDEVLRKAAALLKESCGKDDIVARLGGDEFALLMMGTGEEEAQRKIEKINKNAGRVSGLPLDISISMGYATMNNSFVDFGTLFTSAEEMMYRNKLISGDSVRNSILNTFINTLHEKSIETQEHCGRMQDLCRKMGRKMSLPGQKIDELVLLAALHDIGKIAIANEILTKKVRLTDEEMDQIKKHAEVGFRITSSCQEVAHISNFILCHHERWDGSGYPQGLKGEEIPFESRIISIVDAFDVMINDRPYRTGIEVEDAIKELVRCGGSQFDPKLIGVFVEMISEQRSSRNIYA
ncbi:PAS domain S-box-containing protein/diguanylate cyclase (GGDEF) domain-containing protein [Dethiosulfatibacter aminovorans DSM 17477]|uniref:PAS domain S-box-containing protein/diguanylate cyclase (GGDEF) domain-containing protein n=1 Tax=Dethiosulfatibacter aminovorans DSM 17477 TaxID=1121476 RepID=A0A1M6EF85_9FIRM|nr:HD domain-containing phosphohydrolase [Dethiosulfatibacter aminovorans]SHI84142.1 PAS domain S-box-containing protein/diguanylate cyclase (GGDEF) domain-containing protein [Dethiosulfatibacter aminovorans DSM 17477]